MNVPSLLVLTSCLVFASGCFENVAEIKEPLGADTDALDMQELAEPRCDDGILNGSELGVDCGGFCEPCEDLISCEDGVQNGDEEGVDCGGEQCEPCNLEPEHCSDRFRNETETDVDCGGPDCGPCSDDLRCVEHLCILLD